MLTQAITAFGFYGLPVDKQKKEISTENDGISWQTCLTIMVRIPRHI